MADDDQPETDEKKERILHTRVPDSLDRHLKRRARSLGMSVSTVVRHVLLNTFGLVEDIVTDSANLALAIGGEEPLPPRPERPAPPVEVDDQVLGWQEAVLARNAVCARCNEILPRGTRAAIGVHERPGARAIVCLGCLAALTAPGGER